MISLRSFVIFALAATAVACHDSGPKPPGPPASLSLVAGGGQTALASHALAGPITVAVKDASGTALSGKTVAVAVTSGGGALAGSTIITDASGVATLPAWTLGKSAVPQKVRATIDTLKLDIDATVQTSYDIVVRFFGPSMSASDRALFTNAAARLSGIVIGDIDDVSAQAGQYSSACGVPNQPAAAEVVDDIVIYASIQDIDGPGKVLARSGPCLGRTTSTGFMSAVGVMEFDSADLSSLSGSGSLQDVITHEMLHVLGFGVFWDDFLVGGGTSDPRFNGTNGKLGCAAVGGAAVCTTGVPVESQGGAGTADSHWRERTAPSFDNELMTGFINAGVNPLSKMTIGSMADLGYEVNNDDADDFQFTPAALRAAGSLAPPSPEWEIVIKPQWFLDATGRARRINPQ